MDSGRKQDRKALSLLVKLQHPNLDTFVEQYATNLSPGGMFIRTKSPPAIGTRVRFEVQIAGGVRVMKGSAEVKWVRQPGDPAGAAGMGVEFEELEASTRALVDRMLEAARSRLQALAEPDPAAELEAQLRATYGDPSKARAQATASIAPPLISAIAPLISPLAPKQPPVRPALPFDEPPDFASEVPIEFEPSTPDDAIDLDLDLLIASTPAPPVEAPDEPLALASPPELFTDFELLPEADSAVSELELDSGDAPPPLPPEFDSDLELDLGSAPPEPPDFATDLEVELEPAAPTGPPAPVSRPASPAGTVQAFAPPAPSSLGGAPAVSAAAASTAGAPAARSSPTGAPAASSAPSPLAGAPAAARSPQATAPAVPPVPPGRPSPAGAPPARAVPPVPISTLPTVRRDAQPEEENKPPPVLAKPSAAPPSEPRRAKGPVFLRPPEKIDETGPVIGIDLGTSNSCVGILQNGKPIVMRSKQGYNTLPSIVSVTPTGKLLVAHPAKNQMLLNPNHTIYGAKRLVGRAFDSATVQQVRERFHYEVCADDAGRAAVKLGEHVLSLEEVQGLVLRECREMAEREMGKPISRAVVTVPAYYSEPQREAVRKAGAMAGLKVERILNEPTAAALAFGMNRELNKKVLVYDLGGGTFDATVLKIEKNVFEVLATGGDTFLGGVDFDNAIVDVLMQKFQKAEGIPFSGDSVALSRVSEIAEKAKCALSEQTTFEVHVPMVMAVDGGQWKDLRCTLTREDLNDATGALVDRTLDVVRDVLLDAGMKASDVDDIILVGGQSRMPRVKEKLKELFGKPAQASVNADEAVALGAALYSGSVDKVSSVVLIDVLPMTIGIGMTGGAFKRVIERNTALPAQRSFSLPTSRDNETTLEFDVFQGEDPNIAGNDYLGTVRIEGLPKAPKGLVKVAVTLRLDAECVLHAEAVDLQSRKTVHTTLATRYTPDEVQKKLGLSQEQVRKVNEKRAQDLSSRGGGFWSFLKKVVGK